MSWSVSYLGTPPKIVEALQAESERVSGQRKVEFDSALPHLVGLVKDNFAPEGQPVPMLQLKAFGSGTSQSDPASGEVKQTQRSCSVSIERIYVDTSIYDEFVERLTVALDKALTKRMQKAGQLLALHLLDHLVVATNGFVSLAAAGVI